jgi:endonuclease-3 related protein
MHEALLAEFGPLGWWPGETPFEVAVGAILTQNTNWRNVEKALGNLQAAGPLTPAELLGYPPETLAELIRPAGYFRRKAGRLINFLRFLADEIEDMERANLHPLQDAPLPEVREKLLAVSGIGPETADAIALYALGLPTFVVDAYTARICGRHGLIPEETSYDELQDLFTQALPEDVELYKEYHAQLVMLGKTYCKKSAPLCDSCPVNPLFA